MNDVRERERETKGLKEKKGKSNLSLLKHVLSLFKKWYLIFRVGKELNSPPLLHERTHAHCTLPSPLLVLNFSRETKLHLKNPNIV